MCQYKKFIGGKADWSPRFPLYYINLIIHSTNVYRPSTMYSCRQWRTGKPGVLQFLGKQSPTWLSDWTTMAMCQVPETLIRKRKSDKVPALVDYTFQQTRWNWNISSSQCIRQLHVLIVSRRKERRSYNGKAQCQDPSENIASGMRPEGGAGTSHVSTLPLAHLNNSCGHRKVMWAKCSCTDCFILWQLINTRCIFSPSFHRILFSNSNWAFWECRVPVSILWRQFSMFSGIPAT